MKNSDFVGMAKQHLPYLQIQDKYDNQTYQINDNWKQQIIYWGTVPNSKAFIEVLLTYYPDGYLKKSNKKAWAVFAEKHNDADDWEIRTPFRTWN